MAEDYYARWGIYCGCIFNVATDHIQVNAEACTTNNFTSLTDGKGVVSDPGNMFRIGVLLGGLRRQGKAVKL